MVALNLPRPQTFAETRSLSAPVLTDLTAAVGSFLKRSYSLNLVIVRH